MGKRTRLVLSNSERGDFNACRRYHRLRYVDGLRPRVEAPVLTWGTVIHTGMEGGLRAAATYLRAHCAEVDAVAVQCAIEEAVSASALAVLGAAGEVERGVREAGLDSAALDERLDDLDDLRRVGPWAVEHTLRSTLPSDLLTRVLLAVELPFEAPVPDSLGRASALWYAGKIDAVWYDRASGSVLVDDHKTTDGDATATGVERRIQLDPQMSGYLHAVRYLLRRDLGSAGEHALRPMWGAPIADEGVLGVSPEAVRGWCRYNVIKRAAPRAPARNQDGTVSAAAIETTAEIYEAALVEQEQVLGKSRTEKQAALLARIAAQHDRWHSRQEFARTEDDHRAWLADLKADSRLMRLALARPEYATRNPGNCTRANSLPCSMRRVCLNDSPETRAEYRVADVKHEEVTDDQDQGGQGRQGEARGLGF